MKYLSAWYVKYPLFLLAGYAGGQFYTVADALRWLAGLMGG
jgi:hypothetical protein